MLVPTAKVGIYRKDMRNVELSIPALDMECW